MKASPPHRRTRSPRPSYVAAPPLTRPDDAAEGADVLAEVPGPTGILLFHALRDFMLWVETPAAERRGLFPHGAGARLRDEMAAAAPDQELWAPLLTLAQMADAPDAADAGRLVYACRAVARWAERSRAPATRLAFVQAAALALRSDPKLALETGRLARDLARPAHAESWFRAAIKLSRRRDWESYAWAFIGLGVLYLRSGNYPAAQTVIRRALRAGDKRRLRDVQGSAHHHLFVILADMGRLSDAIAHARTAFEVFGSDHPNMLSLAHDLGRLWLLQRQFARAVPVFDALVPQMSDPRWRVLATANLAHAAAGAGRRAKYESARNETLSLSAAPECAERIADVLLVLSWADAEAGEWERAIDSAERAVAAAIVRGEADNRIKAEQVLDRVRHRMAEPTPVHVESPADGRVADRLAFELVRTLVPAGAA
jgi:tetratricopeptide (TPR) repeat protein